MKSAGYRRILRRRFGGPPTQSKPGHPQQMLTLTLLADPKARVSARPPVPGSRRAARPEDAASAFKRIPQGRRDRDAASAIRATLPQFAARTAPGPPLGRSPNF